MKRRFNLVALVLITLLTSIFMASCQSPIPRQDVVGRMMPDVVGESLDGQVVSLPQRDRGRPAEVLVGYKQRAQFDADRWLFGLLQAETPVELWELPTIPGIFGGLASSWIDNGMRGGIPKEDWGVVVTLYGDDADRMKDFTGTEDGHNIRVMLIDSRGQVQWSHDRGYSAGKMLELDRLVRSMVENR